MHGAPLDLEDRDGELPLARYGGIGQSLRPLRGKDGEGYITHQPQRCIGRGGVAIQPRGVGVRTSERLLEALRLDDVFTEVDVIEVDRLGAKVLPIDNKSGEVAHLHADMLRLDLPRVHVAEVAHVVACAVGRRLACLIGRVAIDGKLHGRAGVHRRTGSQTVFESLFIDDLNGHEVGRGEARHAVKAAGVLARYGLVAPEVVEDTPAEVVHMQAGAFALLELQRDDTCVRVHALDQAESHRVPQLAADHVDAVEAQLRHLEELTEMHAAEPAMAVSVDAATATQEALHKVAVVRSVAERDPEVRLVWLILAQVAAVEGLAHGLHLGLDHVPLLVEMEVLHKVSLFGCRLRVDVFILRHSVRDLHRRTAGARRLLYHDPVTRHDGEVRPAAGRSAGEATPTDTSATRVFTSESGSSLQRLPGAWLSLPHDGLVLIL